jgi:hypothetical protein
MEAASDNRRRILGSSLFGDPPAPPYASRQPDPEPISIQTQPVRRSRDDFIPTQTFADTMPAQSFNLQDFNYDTSAIGENFTLTFKPRPILRNTQFRRLDVPANAQMRILRDELNRSTEQFSKRLRQIGLT